jgi:transcription elongation factor Elf1
LTERQTNGENYVTTVFSQEVLMEEFRSCPTCGYGRGFHTSFQKEGNRFRIIFICPECGSSFDLGLIQSELKEISPVKGETY